MRTCVLFALVCLATLCFFDESEARCWRYCRYICRYHYGFGVRCGLYCGIHCSFRGKRDVSSGSVEMAKNVTKHETPMPRDFNFYDTNDNGKISQDEFAAALDMDDEDAKFLMRQADKNEDSFVDKEEFKEAPWPFERKDDDKKLDEPKPTKKS